MVFGCQKIFNDKGRWVNPSSFWDTPEYLPLVPLNVIVLYIISEQILKPSQKQMTFSNFFGIIT